MLHKENQMNIKVVLQSEIKHPYSAVAYGIFESEKHPEREMEFLGDEAVGLVSRLREDKIFSGKPRELFSSLIGRGTMAKGIVLLGLGNEDKFAMTQLREIAAGSLSEFRRLKAKKAAVFLPSFLSKKLSFDEAAQTVTEALLLASYRFDQYRLKSDASDSSSKNLPEEIDLIVSKAGEKSRSEKGFSAGEVIASSINFARNLGNEPANIMTPTRLTEEAKKMARETGLKCAVLDEKEIRKLKMGGIIGVAQGSTEPPYVVILEHAARNPKKTLCLVGKGITFDTGGISIKPAKDMEKMKYDMMGAAAVIAVMRAVAKLKLPFHVIGITPICENLPGENPQRPGDVVIAHNKKSVEVINTDAEGRLILMDALSYSEKFKADAIIDLATLTGAVAATFGDKCIGLMTNNEKLRDRIIEAGKKSGERCWELPLWDDYLDSIKSEIADLKNVGSGYAGTIVAGKFLEQFVPKGKPWAHLDIAGVAWADSSKPFNPKGPTGAGIRLIIQLLRDWK